MRREHQNISLIIAMFLVGAFVVAGVAGVLWYRDASKKWEKEVDAKNWREVEARSSLSWKIDKLKKEHFEIRKKLSQTVDLEDSKRKALLETMNTQEDQIELLVIEFNKMVDDTGWGEKLPLNEFDPESVLKFEAKEKATHAKNK